MIFFSFLLLLGDSLKQGEKNQEEHKWSINASRTFPVYVSGFIRAIKRLVQKLLRFDSSLQITFSLRLLVRWNLTEDVAMKSNHQ